MTFPVQVHVRTFSENLMFSIYLGAFSGPGLNLSSERSFERILRRFSGQSQVEGLAFLVQAPVLHAERFLDHHQSESIMIQKQSESIPRWRNRPFQKKVPSEQSQKAPGTFLGGT